MLLKRSVKHEFIKKNIIMQKSIVEEKLKKSIAGLCGVLDFRFSCMLEDTELELTVNYEYMKDNERLNKLFKKYFKNEENVEKDDKETKQ